MGVAARDELVETPLRVEVRALLLAGVRRAAGIDPGVAVAHRLAGPRDAVVRGEGQRPVLAGIHVPAADELIAVDLERVDGVLGRVADRHVLEDESVGAVGLDANVLGGPDRRAVAGGGVARVDDRVVGCGPGALHLEVAADARAEVRDAVGIGPAGRARRGILAGAGRAADDRHQRLGVRAVVLVGVRDRARALLRSGPVLLALGR